jgi:hypothetical protein
MIKVDGVGIVSLQKASQILKSTKEMISTVISQSLKGKEDQRATHSDFVATSRGVAPVISASTRSIGDQV